MNFIEQAQIDAVGRDRIRFSRREQGGWWVHDRQRGDARVGHVERSLYGWRYVHARLIATGNRECDTRLGAAAALLQVG